MSGVRVPAPLLYRQIRDNILIKRLFSFCKNNQLIFPNDFVIVAISGGMDSVALLDAFWALTDLIPLKIKAIHVNHGIRGAEADRDEYFVRTFCEQRKVELKVEHLQGMDVQSSEAALREARYLAFDAMLAESPGAKLATAHILDDNIETLLMRLAKGSSLKGLRGIPVKRGSYIRPFLFLTREEIERYVQEKQLSFVQDSSNASLQYLRNRIRHQLVPVFRDIFGDQFYHGMAKSLREINAFYDLFEKEFREIANKVASKHLGKIEISLEKYRTLDEPYRHRLIEYCISAFYPLNYSFSKTYLQRIDQFIKESSVGAILKVHKGVQLVKDRQKVIFAMEHPQQTDVLLLEPEIKVKFGAFEIEIRRVRFKDVHFSSKKNVEFICGDTLRFPLIVRHWQAGDRFYPLGLGKSQKVKEFFINQKIDILTKNEIPIICCGEAIVWIGGYRLDERFRVHEKCKNIYQLTIENRNLR